MQGGPKAILILSSALIYKNVSKIIFLSSIFFYSRPTKNVKTTVISSLRAFKSFEFLIEVEIERMEEELM